MSERPGIFLLTLLPPPNVIDEDPPAPPRILIVSKEPSRFLVKMPWLNLSRCELKRLGKADKGVEEGIYHLPNIIHNEYEVVNPGMAEQINSPNISSPY